MTKKIEVPTEYQEACCFVDWLELMKQQGKIIDYCHIANESYGGTRADMLRGTKLKRMGRKRGVFDYQIFVHNKFGYERVFNDESVTIDGKPTKDGYWYGQLVCVELKKTKGGKVSEEQKEWQQVYDHCGIPANICRGAEEAIDFVKQFI